jgi:hypothetical protein
MDDRIKTLKEHADTLFSQRMPLLSLWQEINDNFYPQRADYTASRSIGRDFAALLTTSYPIMVREELGSQISTMLRPASSEWFQMGITRDDKVDNEGRRWLEWATRFMRRAMYDPLSQFTRATKEGDQDFATIGQCVVSAEMNRDLNGLLFRCWHPRDVVWAETYAGLTLPIYRKWEPTLYEYNKVFRGNISAKAKLQLAKKPYDKIKLMHVIIPAEDYEAPVGKRWKQEFVSIYFEVDEGHIAEEVGRHDKMYVIPRWQTVSGSQYAYSPSTVAALPDARLIQAMTLTILEAGEKASNPPLVATQEVVRSDIQTYAGGITWVDAAYDERLGEALRPMNLDYRGLPEGVKMLDATKRSIYEAFYLNKLTMPTTGGPDKTAYQVGQEIQQYIRQALPLFEPMEMDYNGGLCKQVFEVMKHAPGGFGNQLDVPKSIRGADVNFTFESPLHQAIDKEKVTTFQATRELLAQAISLDPSSAAMVDVQISLRDALEGNGTPDSWIRTKEQMVKIQQAHDQEQKTQEMLSTINQGADTAKKIGDAGASLQPMTGSSPQANNIL